MTKEMEWTINLIKRAYINTYGEEKWISLTDDEKHDAVMILARNLEKALKQF